MSKILIMTDDLLNKKQKKYTSHCVHTKMKLNWLLSQNAGYFIIVFVFLKNNSSLENDLEPFKQPLNSWTARFSSTNSVVVLRRAKDNLK